MNKNTGEGKAQSCFSNYYLFPFSILYKIDPEAKEATGYFFLFLPELDSNKFQVAMLPVSIDWKYYYIKIKFPEHLRQHNHLLIEIFCGHVVYSILGIVVQKSHFPPYLPIFYFS